LYYSFQKTLYLNQGDRDIETPTMTSKQKTVIAFDLYGTLLSTESIAKELAIHLGDDKAGEVAGLWRRYIYTFSLRASERL
jgi:hypothetical protein